MALFAALAVTGLAYVIAYHGDRSVLPSPAMPQWWAWTDQSRYLRAAKAWSVGDLDPAQHWYPAGYPLLAAPFVALLPSNPFYLVDLVCILATAGLTVALGGKLAPGSTWARPAATLAFCLAVPLNALQVRSYVEPWTSTATTPLTLCAFLLMLRLWERPSFGRAAATGLALGAITLFRPTDALPPMLTISLTSLGFLRVRALFALAIGIAVPVGLAVLAHLAVFGFARGDYLSSAAATGFEWRLLPYRWVTVMVSAAPDWPGLVSLSQAFPVFITGTVGTVACLVATSGRARRAHLAVSGAVWLHVALFLCYRDLHAEGLIRFGNYHYFKWCVPVLALYSWFLFGVVGGARRRWAAWATGLAVAAALFAWRVDWTLGPGASATIGDGTLTIDTLPRGIGNELYVPAQGDFLAIFLGNDWLEIDGRRFAGNENFKLVPWRDGFLFAKLRSLPSGPATLHVDPGVHLRGPVALAHLRFTLRAPRLPSIVAKFGSLWW